MILVVGWLVGWLLISVLNMACHDNVRCDDVTIRYYMISWWIVMVVVVVCGGHI